MEEYKEIYFKCKEIAIVAHDGQVDKAGAPYILHPFRVAEKCKTFLSTSGHSNDFSYAVACVALLHDVLEDTKVTADDLRKDEIPEKIIEGVISVTRKEDEPYSDFVKRAAENEYGKYVKYFDIEDNLDVRRLHKVSYEDINRLNKYLKWYNYLEKIINE